MRRPAALVGSGASSSSRIGAGSCAAGDARRSPRGFPRFRVDKETGIKSIRNRTDNIARSPDRTASGLMGDVALSVSPLLV